jgi:hypothetical protein
MESITVESYAGFKAEEYPLRFHLKGIKIEIKRIKEAWLTSGYRCFKVLADNDNIYVLKYGEINDSWKLLTTGRP